MKRKPVHVPEEAYEELQRQIQAEVDNMGEKEHQNIEVGTLISKNVMICLLIRLNASSSEVKFADDAWGYTQSFTEINWKCTGEITRATAIKLNGKEVESDFDSSRLELAFGSTEWK